MFHERIKVWELFHGANTLLMIRWRHRGKNGNESKNIMPLSSAEKDKKPGHERKVKKHSFIEKIIIIFVYVLIRQKNC